MRSSPGPATDQPRASPCISSGPFLENELVAPISQQVVLNVQGNKGDDPPSPEKGWVMRGGAGGRGGKQGRDKGGKKSPLACGPATPTPPVSHHLGQDVHGSTGQHVLHGHRGLAICLGFQDLHQLFCFLIERSHQANQGAGETAQASAAAGTSPDPRHPSSPLWRDSVQSGAGGLPQPFRSPHESQLTGWGCNNQTKPWGSQSPATQDGPCPFMLLLVIPHVPFLPLGPSTLTPRRRGNVETPEDSGEEGKKGLWGLQESRRFPL